MNKKEFIFCDWETVDTLVNLGCDKKKDLKKRPTERKETRLMNLNLQKELKIRMIKSMLVYNRTLYDDHLICRDNYKILKDIYEEEQDHLK